MRIILEFLSLLCMQDLILVNKFFCKVRPFLIVVVLGSLVSAAMIYLSDLEATFDPLTLSLFFCEKTKHLPLI